MDNRIQDLEVKISVTSSRVQTLINSIQNQHELLELIEDIGFGAEIKTLFTTLEEIKSYLDN